MLDAVLVALRVVCAFPMGHAGPQALTKLRRSGNGGPCDYGPLRQDSSSYLGELLLAHKQEDFMITEDYAF